MSGQTETAEKNKYQLMAGVSRSLMALVGFKPGLVEKAGFRQAKGKPLAKDGEAESETRMLYSVEAPSHHLSTSLPCWRVATLSRKYIRKATLALSSPLCGSGGKGRASGQPTTMCTWAGPPAHHLVHDNQIYI